MADRLPRSGGALLVECLVAADVPLLTCVPGESFLPVLDALHDPAGVRRLPPLVTTRHEAAAANMAEAAGKLTGRAAVCFVTRGPGATHASIGVHTAAQDGTPLLLVVGQVPRPFRGRQAFQEMDYRLVFGSSAKAVIELDAAHRIPEHVERAMTLAHSGRPGPVVLVAPEDVLGEATTSPPSYFRPPEPPAPAANELAALASRLREADRPVLLVGGPGWTQAVSDGVRRFAEAAEIPVVAAFRWQDTVDNRSPSYAGHLGLGCSPLLRRRVAAADLLVVLGARLDEPTTDGYALLDALDPAALVVVTPEPAELPSLPAGATGLLGGTPAVAAFLAGSAPAAGSPVRREWTRALRAEHEQWRAAPAQRPEPDLARIVEQVRDALPDDAVVTNGAGNFTIWLQRYFEFRRCRTQVAPRNGAMGYGLPAGLAAAALDATHPVVTFTGDGCLLMSGSELATAVQHELGVVIVVVNNGMYGTIRMHQERRYPGRPVATDLRNPDFAAYAQSFGMPGVVVTRTADFAPALADALARRGPSLIEVRTDPRQLTPDLRLSAAD